MHTRRRFFTSWLPPLLVGVLLIGAGALFATAANQTKQADLATNAIAGGIIALAILSLERSLGREQERQGQLASLAAASAIRGMRFVGADLHDAYAVGKDLTECVFSDADMRRARLAEAQCRRASFHHADLRRADVRFGNLTQADLRAANLRHADLGAARLVGADLSDADLRAANLFARPAGGPYMGADLSGAALFGADLRDVALVVRDAQHPDHTVTVVLKDAKANEATRWPRGFDPTAAGVTVLAGSERRPHDGYVAFKDPGFEDVTASTPVGEAEVFVHSHSRTTLADGYEGQVLAALKGIREELASMHSSLAGPDEDDDGS